MDNLVLLCRRHHRLVHEEGYGIKTAANREFQFTLPDGRVLPNNRHGRFRGNVTALKARNHDNGIEFSAFTAVPELDEGPMDHDLGVLALIQRE